MQDNHVILSFKNYQDYSNKIIKNKPNSEKLLELISHNQKILDEIINDLPFDSEKCMESNTMDPQDYDRIKSTLRQFSRDWAVEGKRERDATYLPILNTLESFYKNLDMNSRGSIKVLVPGAGLGRLVFEVACRGLI